MSKAINIIKVSKAIDQMTDVSALLDCVEDAHMVVYCVVDRLRKLDIPVDDDNLFNRLASLTCDFDEAEAELRDYINSN